MYVYNKINIGKIFLAYNIIFSSHFQAFHSSLQYVQNKTTTIKDALLW